MTKAFALGLALAIVAIGHVTGLIRAIDLSHPFWHLKATLLGAGGGVLLAGLLFWLRSRIATGLAVIALPVAVFATWRAARIFINSADYEPVAGKVWFFGYHASVALFVVVTAVVLARVLHSWRQM